MSSRKIYVTQTKIKITFISIIVYIKEIIFISFKVKYSISSFLSFSTANIYLIISINSANFNHDDITEKNLT